MLPGPGRTADPRRAAQARLDALAPGRYAARVLEPSPPAVTDPPWVADDPVHEPTPAGRPVVSPVGNADLTWDELARGHASLAAWCAERWLGAWRPLDAIEDPVAWAAGRTAWHRLAEHVLAPARHQATGKIGLRFTRGGIGTPFSATPAGNRQWRLDRTELVVAGRDERRVPITTFARRGRRRRRRAGCADGGLRADDQRRPRRAADRHARRDVRLAAWFGFAASVLEELRGRAPDAASTRLQIWPEHFDASVDLGDEAAGRRGTFGASPGDEQHPLPYLYVTHWADVAADAYWNDAAFGGASLGYDALHGEDGRAVALAFLRRGVAVLGGA